MAAVARARASQPARYEILIAFLIQIEREARDCQDSLSFVFNAK